jgi:amino acid transporter
MVVALLVNVFTLCSFAELSGIIPRAGSLNHYTQAALGPFPALVAVLAAYVVPTIFAAGSEAAIPGIIVHDLFWPQMPARVFSVLLVLVLLITNLRGIVWFSTVQIITAGAMILSIAAVGIIGLLDMGSGVPLQSSPGSFNASGWHVFSLVALGFWLFGGAEFVTVLAEEIKRPKVYIPVSMFLGLFIIFVAGSLYGLASLRYVRAEDLARSLTPHVDLAGALLGRAGQVWMSTASVLASATTLNTILCVVPRMLYGMAQSGQLPSILGRLNRFQVPSTATYLACGLLLIPVLIGVTSASTFVSYILASTFTYVVGYIIANVDLIVLRIKAPHLRSSGFRTPLFPLPQMLSLSGLVWILFNISPDPSLTRGIYTIAFTFLGISVVYAALWVRLKEKKGLFQTVPIPYLVENVGLSEGSVNTRPSDAEATG